jgi:uncharacterized protein (TIGR02145 family)
MHSHSCDSARCSLLPSFVQRCGSLAALLILTTQVHSADLAVSGKVFDRDGNPIPGIVVSFAHSETQAITDSSGAWSLNSSTAGIQPRLVVPAGASGNLKWNGRRLEVRFGETNVTAHGKNGAQPIPARDRVLARTLATQDTLLYSMGGRVRLRDTISVSQTEMVRTLDTNFNPAIIYGYLNDSRDGRVYRTVRIRQQVWMAENLNFKKTSASLCYDRDTANCRKYGSLYDWAKAMNLPDACKTGSCVNAVQENHQGLCPAGWHIPTYWEWKTLTGSPLDTATVGMTLKANSNLWSKNTGMNDSGFTILPAGQYSDGYFLNLGFRTHFWMTRESDGYFAWFHRFSTANSTVYTNYNVKTEWYSIRCLQNLASASP